jgi:hypothetical protein
MSDERAEAARAIIAAHTAAEVLAHDDGSRPAMHDLVIRYPDGRVAVVEVTSAEDQRRAGDYGALRRQPVLRDERIEGGWLVILKEGASVNKARRLLPNVLFRFEEAGLTEVSVSRSHEDHAWARELLLEVGAQSASSGIMESGAIGLTGAMRVEWLSSDPDDVVTFVERFSRSADDNLRKLRHAGADERHLFIWGGVFPQDWASLRPLGLDIDALPSRAPNLPPEITDVWVAAESERPSRIVHWNAAEGWHEAGYISS